MSRTGILSTLELAKGVNITSALDLRYASRRARRKARWHLVLMFGTSALTAANFLPDLQSPLLWAACAIVALLLARTFPAVRASLLHARAVRASALRLQALVHQDAHGEQAFAYKLSAFQPRMKLRVAVISKDNRVSIRTYRAVPGEQAWLKVEGRQVYAKAWLEKVFGEKWRGLAAERGIPAHRAKGFAQGSLGTARLQ